MTMKTVKTVICPFWQSVNLTKNDICMICVYVGFISCYVFFRYNHIVYNFTSYMLLLCFTWIFGIVVVRSIRDHNRSAMGVKGSSNSDNNDIRQFVYSSCLINGNESSSSFVTFLRGDGCRSTCLVTGWNVIHFLLHFILTLIFPCCWDAILLGSGLFELYEYFAHPCCCIYDLGDYIYNITGVLFAFLVLYIKGKLLQ